MVQQRRESAGFWSAGFRGASTYFIQTLKKRVFQQKFRPKYA